MLRRSGVRFRCEPLAAGRCANNLKGKHAWHESVSDVTMGTETAMDVRRWTPSARTMSKSSWPVAPFYIAHRMGGTGFETRARAGCVVARGFQALEVSVRRCCSGSSWRSRLEDDAHHCQGQFSDLEHSVVAQ